MRLPPREMGLALESSQLEPQWRWAGRRDLGTSGVWPPGTRSRWRPLGVGLGFRGSSQTRV
jgi:hypothetical protein